MEKHKHKPTLALAPVVAGQLLAPGLNLSQAMEPRGHGETRTCNYGTKTKEDLRLEFAGVGCSPPGGHAGKGGVDVSV